MSRRESGYFYPSTLAIACVLIGVYLGQHHLLPAYYDPPNGLTWYYAFSADTTRPFDGLSYVTAAATHLSGVHLLKNLALLGAAGVLVERRMSNRIFLISFVITAIVGTSVFAISGYLTGAERLGAGASGGTYAMLALASLTVSTVTIVVRSRTISIPLWGCPAVLIALEAVRAIVTPVSASPYPNYAHIAGVCVAVGIWWVAGRPRRPFTVDGNAKD